VGGGNEAIVIGGNGNRATVEGNRETGAENPDPIANCGAKLYVEGKLKIGASIQGVGDSVEEVGRSRRSM
jgi:hypothetical protein